MTKIIHPAWLLSGCLFASSVGACTVSGSTLAFGAINPLAAAASTSTATISISCPSTTPYTVALSAGGGSFSTRSLVSGIHALDYNLYIDNAHSAVWGDGTAGTVTVNGSADSNGTQHTIYGNIPWQPQAWPGTYSDTIVITVSY